MQQYPVFGDACGRILVLTVMDRGGTVHCVHRSWFAHEGACNCIAATSRFICSGGDDRRLCVWSSSELGVELLRLETEHHSVSTVTAFEDRIFAGCHDRMIMAYRLEWKGDIPLGAEPVARLSEADQTFRSCSMVYCKDEGGDVSVVVGASDGSVRLVKQTVDGTLETQLCANPHFDAVQCVVQSPLGGWTSAGEDKAICIWHKDDSKGSSRMEGHIASVLGIAYHNESIISAGGDRSVKVWNNNRCTQSVESGHSNVVSTVLVLQYPEGILTGGYDGEVRFHPFATVPSTDEPLLPSIALFRLEQDKAPLCCACMLTSARKVPVQSVKPERWG